jgi:hypothetical protein
VLVLWFMEGASVLGKKTMPVRPWYKHKRGLCFNDVLRSAQWVLVQQRVSVFRRGLADLRPTASAPSQRPVARQKRAA